MGRDRLAGCQPSSRFSERLSRGNRVEWWSRTSAVLLLHIYISSGGHMRTPHQTDTFPYYDSQPQNTLRKVRCPEGRTRRFTVSPSSVTSRPYHSISGTPSLFSDSDKSCQVSGEKENVATRSEPSIGQSRSQLKRNTIKNTTKFPEDHQMAPKLTPASSRGSRETVLPT